MAEYRYYPRVVIALTSFAAFVVSAARTFLGYAHQSLRQTIEPIWDYASPYMQMPTRFSASLFGMTRMAAILAVGSTMRARYDAFRAEVLEKLTDDRPARILAL